MEGGGVEAVGNDNGYVHSLIESTKKGGRP
jgi:hypothetical protein